MRVRRSGLGALFLLISLAGLFILLILQKIFFASTNAPWYLILPLGFFEAATVGSLADWFAVTALFREVKIPFLRRHTNIILRNKDKVVSGAADMVANTWLTPEVLTARIQSWKIADTLVSFVTQNLDLFLNLIRDFAGEAVSLLEHPRLGNSLAKNISDAIREADIYAPLSRLIRDVVSKNEHQQFLDKALHFIHGRMLSPEMEHEIRTRVERLLQRKFVTRFARFVHIVDEEKLTIEILRELQNYVLAIQNQPDHPHRQLLTLKLLDMADALETQKPETVNVVESIRSRLLNGIDWQPFLQQQLERLNTYLNEQLVDNDTTWMKFLRKKILRNLRDLQSDPVKSIAVDTWLKDTIVKMVEENHSMIRELVTDNLGKMSDEQLINPIRAKVWDDLQMIRVNGAVVGGLAGLLITAIRYFLLT